MNAERKLARILQDAGIDIEPALLGDVIRKHWDQMAPLAHLIHGRPDDTKDGSARGKTA